MAVAAENKLQNEIRLVLEMTARVDERVKLIVEKQSDMTQRLNGFIDSHNTLASRVTVLEAKAGNTLQEMKTKMDQMVERVVKLESDPLCHHLAKLEGVVLKSREDINSLVGVVGGIDNRVDRVEEGQDGIWSKSKYGLDLVVKAVWALAIGYLLYKLGWSAPNTPH